MDEDIQRLWGENGVSQSLVGFREDEKWNDQEATWVEEEAMYVL